MKLRCSVDVKVMLDLIRRSGGRRADVNLDQELASCDSCDVGVT